MPKLTQLQKRHGQQEQAPVDDMPQTQDLGHDALREAEVENTLHDIDLLLGELAIQAA